MILNIRRRITKQKHVTILRSFVVDISAVSASRIAGVNRKTADRYYNIIREVVFLDAVRERKEMKLGNGIEIDESYFGPRRVRGKRGRGAGSKVVVLGLLKRSGRIYTKIIKKAEKKEILPVILRTVKSGSDIYTDGWKSYDALAVYGYNHKKVIHERNEFSDKKETHINGVESFWSYAKRRMNKFNGIRKVFFQRHLLESEWRFNHRKTIMHDIEKLLRNF
ncbi:MAG: IS1595 family transposase [Patescibacteria group bacterium]